MSAVVDSCSKREIAKDGYRTHVVTAILRALQRHTIGLLGVARQIGYTHTGVLDDPRFDPTDESMTLRLIDASLAGPQEQLGILLYDGVTELGLSGTVHPFVGSFSARTYAMAPERRIVRSRNGPAAAGCGRSRSLPEIPAGN